MADFLKQSLLVILVSVFYVVNLCTFDLTTGSQSGCNFLLHMQRKMNLMVSVNT